MWRGLLHSSGRFPWHVQIPSQVEGVVNVAATGPNGLKAYYSNYGKLFVAVRLMDPLSCEMHFAWGAKVPAARRFPPHPD